MKVKAEYPCGMKTEISGFFLFQSLFGIISIESIEKTGTKWDCPLHGKDCLSSKNNEGEQ